MSLDLNKAKHVLKKLKSPAVVATGFLGATILPTRIGYKEEAKDSTVKGLATSAAMGSGASYISTSPERLLPKKLNRKLLKTIGRKHYKTVAKHAPTFGAVYGLFSGASSYQSGKATRQLKDKLFSEKKATIIPRDKMKQYRPEEVQHLNVEYVDPNSLQPLQDKVDTKKVKKVNKKLSNPDSNYNIKPIVINGDNFILDGHHRWVAFKQVFNGSQNIPVRILPDKMSKKAFVVFSKLL